VLGLQALQLRRVQLLDQALVERELELIDGLGVLPAPLVRAVRPVRAVGLARFLPIELQISP